MKLILVRHGESKANAKGIRQGQAIDSKLSKRGIKQAKKLANRLKFERISHIYSSDLRRAKSTAEIINRFHNKKIIYDSRLREKDYAKDSERESLLKCKSFLKDILKLKGNVIAISHGGKNKVLLNHILQKAKENRDLFWQGNCCINAIIKKAKSLKINSLNDMSHLWADRKLMHLFEKIQVIPFNPLKPDHKNMLLYRALFKEGYDVQKKEIVFDWRDLPIPKKIEQLLGKHLYARSMLLIVRVHGAKLIVDSSFDPKLARLGFPVTKKWSGLENTSFMTYIKKITPKRKIKGKQNIKFLEALNKWLIFKRSKI